VEITEAEVAQALASVLSKNDNDDCEKNVEVCGCKI